MVTSTEKNFVIAVKLPFDLQERLLTFPFLHTLRDRYQEAEFHIITPKHNIEILNLLPFKAYYHEIDEGEIETVFDVHRFAVNAKIYGLDLYVSLTNSFVDASLGFALRATQRLGFSDGWKTMMLNQKTLRPVGHHMCEDYFALLRAHVGGDIDNKLKVTSRELPSVVGEWEMPYVAVNLTPIRGAAIEEEWVELISHFGNQRFIFFTSEVHDNFKLLFETFTSKLPKNNHYTQFVHADWIDLGKLLAFARGVITYNGPAATLSAYTGSKTLVLYDREDPQRTGPFYFLGEVLIQYPEEAKPEIMSPRKTFDMTAVADKAHEFFKL